MAAVGCAADRRQAEPPVAIMRVHVNILCRKKFRGLPTEFQIGEPQGLGEESGLDPFDAGQHRAHCDLLPGLDQRSTAAGWSGAFRIGRASMPYGSMRQGSITTASTGTMNTPNGTR